MENSLPLALPLQALLALLIGSLGAAITIWLTRGAAASPTPQGSTESHDQLAEALASLERILASQQLHIRKLEAAFGEHRQSFERMEAALSEQVETVERRSSDRLTGEFDAIRSRLTELDRVHQAQWRNLQQAVQVATSSAPSNSLSAAGSPTKASPSHAVAPFPNASDSAASLALPAAVPVQPAADAHGALNDLSDEELDALEPELPLPSTKFVPPAPEIQSTLSVELSDEELDALPPDLPTPDKPRRRVLPPPRKPMLNKL